MKLKTIIIDTLSNILVYFATLLYLIYFSVKSLMCKFGKLFGKS